MFVVRQQKDPVALTIPDETLDDLRKASGDALIDIACRLFDADRIGKREATRLTGFSRVEFEGELTKRGLPWIHLDWDETYAKEFEQIAQEPRVPHGDEHHQET